MPATSTEVQNLFVNVLQNLTEKERTVLVRRLGIDWPRETLQQIGNTYTITRERVRQIEDVGIKKIGRIVRGTLLGEVQVMGEKILRISGGIMTKDKLVSAVIQELGINGPINENIIEVILQSGFNIQRNKPQLGVISYFHLPEVNKKMIQDIHREAVKILSKKGDIMEVATVYEMIKIALFSSYGKIETLVIDSVLDVFQDVIKGEEKFIGLEKWKILNPSTLKDKAIYVMKKGKRPFHFVELANVISDTFKEPVKVPTIHNELIRNNEFVLIGRGIYVLKEWGYKAGTVLDVIIDVLGKTKAPLKTEEIINRVLKVRQVKNSTIYMNLQNKQYVERVGRNMYKLKG